MEPTQHGSKQPSERSDTSHASVEGDGVSNACPLRAVDPAGRSCGDVADGCFACCLDAAREGSGGAVGTILEQCRNYLLMVANGSVDAAMRAKLAPSDLVQDTFHVAVKEFSRFRGTSEAELLAWLKQILRSRYCRAASHGCPSGPHEVSLPLPLDDSGASNWIGAAMIDQDATPCRAVMAHEETTAMLQQMTELPDDLSQVIRLRSFQQLSFVEIGRSMNRSAGAARKLWARAVEQLCLRMESRTMSQRPAVKQ